MSKNKMMGTAILVRAINDARRSNGMLSTINIETMNNKIKSFYRDFLAGDSFHNDIVGDDTVGYKFTIQIALMLLSNENPRVQRTLQETLLGVLTTLENEGVSREIPLKEYCEIKHHGMTANRLYEVNRNKGTGVEPTGAPSQSMTWLYKSWLEKFPKQDVWGKSYWESQGVDFSKPIHMRMKFIHKSNFDMTNLEKALIDAILHEDRGVILVDDEIVHKVTKETLAFCEDYKDGRMYFHLENI